MRGGKAMAYAGGTYFILVRLWRKIGNFTYRMKISQGKIAMDGDFRSLAARMPLGSAPSDLKYLKSFC